MKADEIYTQLSSRRVTASELARKAVRKKELIPVLVEGMTQKKAEVKYGSAKALRFLVNEHPDLLYTYFGQFAEMLKSPNNIFQWEAMYLLAGLARVAERSKIEGVLGCYFANIEGPTMITAANSIKGAAEIAKAKPELAPLIMREILRGERGSYETSECYEIVCGQALKVFDKLYKLVEDPTPMVEFAKRHLGSHRRSTHAAAEKLLARHAKKGKVTTL